MILTYVILLWNYKPIIEKMEKYVKALKEVEGIFKNTPAEFSYFLGEDYSHYLIEVILKDGTGVLTIKQFYYTPSELHVTCIVANPYDKEASYVKLIDIASKIAEYTKKPYCKLTIPVKNNAILCKTSELSDSDCISINKTLLDCVINHCEAMQNYDKLSKYGDFYYKIKNL